MDVRAVFLDQGTCRATGQFQAGAAIWAGADLQRKTVQVDDGRHH